MKTRHDSLVVSRRPVLMAGAIAALLAATVGLSRPAWLARLDDRAYDLVTRGAGHAPPTGRVVVVDVDERSLAALGQWPWRRDLLGQFVSRLRDAGASAIAFDVVFAEPDGRAPIPRAADREPPTSATGDEASSPDAVFADALRGGRTVLGYAFTFGGATAPANTCPAHPLGLAMLRTTSEDAPSGLFEASGAVCNLPALTQAAAGSGFLNAAPDSDGILRRVPLLIDFQNRVYPALALAAVMLATTPRELVLRVGNTHTASLFLDDRLVPLDSKGNLLLRYRGPRNTLAHVSAADVMTGQLASNAVRGRIAIVGATALGARETVTTPTDTRFSGVEVQATVADNLMSQDLVSRPELASFTESMITLIIGIAMALAIARTGPLWGSLGALACLIASWAGAVWLLSAKNAFVSPVVPTLGGILELAAINVASVVWEHRRADRASSKLAETQRLMVQSLLSLTEIRDATTGLHSRRTQAYARLLAERLAGHQRFRGFLTPARIELISSLAPLHDIGKVGIPDRLLNKPGLLTLDELEEMRMHPVYGRDVIIRAQQQVGAADDDVLEMAKDIVYTHHERWDGLGYPRGLKGEHIPIPGRVVMLVDVYDAITTRRVYHQPLSHDSAVALIVGDRGTRFDPAVVDAFLDVATAFQRILDDAGVADTRTATG